MLDFKILNTYDRRDGCEAKEHSLSEVTKPGHFQGKKLYIFLLFMTKTGKQKQVYLTPNQVPKLNVTITTALQEHKI